MAEHNAFNAGVDPVGLHNVTLIRLLICYILKNSEFPIDKETAATALYQCGIVNYFETIDAFNELINKGLISEKDGVFSLEQSGAEILNELEVELSVVVKERSMNAIKSIIEAERRKRENRVEFQKLEDGIMVRCRVPQEKFDLIDLRLYMPNEEQAEVVKNNFVKNAPLIYNFIVAAMLGNDEMLGSAIEKFMDEGLEK